jgi:transcriptional regulator of acetoin/glycerol metabolism
VWYTRDLQVCTLISSGSTIRGDAAPYRSSCRTFVDGERIQGEVRRGGDVVVRLGHTVFVLVRDERGHGAEHPAQQVVGPELARIDKVRQHAAGDTLLIHGESGSGKELAARLYHDAGPRKAGPFVAINCATIPEGVAERLLFGAKKGAFSGAIEAAGHFQMAHGGTLFLDEIAELDPAVQAKLLRVLETREVVAVGATLGTPVEVGIVAASHRSLPQLVAERRFRDDLYYRLALATVHLPPLRARKVDIARLVQRAIAAANRTLAPHARLIEACCTRPWPGNIASSAAASSARARRRCARCPCRARSPGWRGRGRSRPWPRPSAPGPSSRRRGWTAARRRRGDRGRGCARRWPGRAG